MSYQRLKEALAKKLRRTERRLYQRATEIARTRAIPTADAMYLLALEEGIDIRRYADEDKLSRIRELAAAVSAVAPVAARPPRATKARPTKPPKSVQITLPSGMTLRDPILPPQIINDAKLMATRVYFLLYIFENSVRELIKRVMARAHGDDWWSTSAPAKVRREVEGRMKGETRLRYHGKRGAHEIYYTNIKHLRHIVTSNWQHFERLFPDMAWFTTHVDVIEASRNVVAHNNPLDSQSIKRLEVYSTDWRNQIRGCVEDGLL